MCGRYYVDDETAREIEKLVKNLDIRRKNTGDLLPSQTALVLCGEDQCLDAREMKWGFPRFDGKGLLINARAESVLDRVNFCESVQNRRCVIPAKGFCEWNRYREKFRCERTDFPVMFMAGCYKEFEGMKHFVILTTAANPSVAPIHNRMPLILEPGEVENWILDRKSTEDLLHKTPVLLKTYTEYEQMRLNVY